MENINISAIAINKNLASDIAGLEHIFNKRFTQQKTVVLEKAMEESFDESKIFVLYLNTGTLIFHNFEYVDLLEKSGGFKILDFGIIDSIQMLRMTYFENGVMLRGIAKQGYDEMMNNGNPLPYEANATTPEDVIGAIIKDFIGVEFRKIDPNAPFICYDIHSNNS